MGRWGAGAPPPAAPLSAAAVQPPVAEDGDVHAAAASVSPDTEAARKKAGKGKGRSVIKRRWSEAPSPRLPEDGGAGFEAREGADGAPVSPTSPQSPRGLFRVGFTFGDQEREEDAQGDAGGDARDAAIPDTTAACANCDHLQDIYAHAVKDPLAIVVCDECGLRKPAKMWLWRTLPQIDTSPAGIVYHTPYYQRRLQDATYLAPPLQAPGHVTHVAYPFPGKAWESNGCIYGRGQIATYHSRLRGPVIQHSVKNPRRSGVRAIASGGALAVSAVQQVLNELRVPAMQLGDGVFDNLCVRASQLARVEERGVPRFRHFHLLSKEVKDKPQGAAGEQGRRASEGDGGGGDIENPDAENDALVADEHGAAAPQRPHLSDVAQKVNDLRQMVVKHYAGAAAEMAAQTQAAMTRPGYRCCVPVDYTLVGADGSAQRPPPPILRYHAKPLEQRLMWNVIESGDDPTRYVDEDRGVLRSHYDPLLDQPISSFDDDVVLGGKDVDFTIPTVCTRDGPNPRGGTGTYQLDVHIATVLFTAHAQFRENEQRVGKLLSLYHEFRRLSSQVERERDRSTKDAASDEPHPLKPNVPPTRHAAERRVEDLIHHLVRAACSGVHGAAVKTKGIAVASKWKPRHSEDGVFSQRTAGALEDYLQVMVPHALATAADFDTDGVQDCLTPLGAEVLGALRFHLGLEGVRIYSQRADAEVLLAGVPAEWWPLAGEEVPVPGFGIPERKALQAFLRSHFAAPGTAAAGLVVDGVIRADTIAALQTYLLNTRHLVQAGLMLPALISRLETEMREVGAEVDVHRQLQEARRARDQAVSADIAIMREMVDEWHQLKEACGGAPPPGVVFGLIQRYPAPDHTVPSIVGAGELSQMALMNRTPYLEVAADTHPHELNQTYKCKLFVRLKGSEGPRYAAETECRPLDRDYKVRLGALVRLHLAKEPEAILIQVVQRGMVGGLMRGTTYGYVTMAPPFSSNPFEPGGAQHRNIRWYNFSSWMGQGHVMAEAFWSQHNPAVPSRAPRPQATFHASDVAAAKREILEGRLDPNDPQYQALVRWLAERINPEDAEGRKAAVRQRQDGHLLGVLLPAPSAPTRSGCLARNDLLKHRWAMLSNPVSAELTNKQDRLLVGRETRKPVPYNPQVSEWGRTRDERSSSIAQTGGMPDTQAWLAKIRKAKNQRATGLRRDVELLSQMVTQPVEEEEKSLCDVIADFFKPITKLRPYRQVVQDAPTAVFTEPPVIQVYIKNGRNLPVRCQAHLLEGEHHVRLARARQSAFGAAGLGLDGAGAGASMGGGGGSFAPGLGSLGFGDTGNLIHMRSRSGGTMGRPGVGDRQDHDDGAGGAPGGAAAGGQNVQEAEADLYVEVRFGPTEVQATRTAIGPDPLFFETLKVTIPFTHLNADTLALIEDPIEIRVFDKVKSHRKVPDLHEPADGNTVNYFEIKRYIGSCFIPLNTLYCNATPTWEGTLKLDVPPVSLGYAHASDLPSGKDTQAEGDRVSALSLYVTLQPKVHVPQHVDEFDPLHSSEPGPVFWHAQRWSTSLRTLVTNVVSGALAGGATAQSSINARKDRITPLVHDTNMQAVLLCRYVSNIGLKPPPSVLESPDYLEFACARFVSVIPHVETLNVSEEDGGRRWSTSAEFLQAGAGDYDEHAILLANYFQNFCYAPYQRFLEVYVVCGRSDQYIRASFVLTRCATTQVYHLWDPVRGTRCPLAATSCVLRDVSIVFDHRNIWCNVQPCGVPSRMDWDFSNRAVWRPLFAAAQNAPQNTCQTPLDRLYAPVHPDDQTVLQLKLVDEIKSLVRDMRSSVRTYLTSFRSLVDTHGRRVLDHILLPAFEEAYTEGYNCGRGEADGERAWLDAKHQELLTLHKGCLREALSSYEMHGMPFHFAWRDLGSIKKEIAASALHATDPMEKDVEFAIGVYVKGYASVGANDFISVWVYVAQMRRTMDRWPGGVKPGGRLG